MSADDAEPRECPACRATGEVVSGLGGSPSNVPCPWCEGTGRVLPEHDAQARWRVDESPDTGVGDSSPS